MNPTAISTRVSPSLVSRLIAAALAVAVTYTVSVGWGLGGLLHGLVGALMQRPSSHGIAEAVGSYWQWLSFAGCFALVVALVARPRVVRVVAIVWLAVTLLFAALSWIAFGPDNATPIALLVGCALTYWLDRTARAA